MREPKVKICGLTKIEDAKALNEAQADYAGFVFYEKSKRNVSIEDAEKIGSILNDRIKKVAVTISPDAKLLEQIEQLGFHILQVHGELKKEVLEKSHIPIWRACNLKEIKDVEQLEQHKKIQGYVIDAGTAGSGNTFDWEQHQESIRKMRNTLFAGKQFILAGGLQIENVRKGIELFSPDVVDISSGVERKEEQKFGQEKSGKDKALILEFVKKVREKSLV